MTKKIKKTSSLRPAGLPKLPRGPKTSSAFFLLFIVAVVAALVGTFFFSGGTKKIVNDKAALNEVVTQYKSGAYLQINIE